MKELTGTLLLFASAILLATAIDEPASKLQALGLPRALSILSLFAIVIGLLALVVVVLIPVITDEATSLQNDIGGHNVTYTEYPDAFHDFLMLTQLEPERTDSLKKIDTWLKSL